MKKIYLLLLFIPFDSFSQPILKNIENFNVGDSMLFYVLKSPNIKEGDAGKNITWNFSDLPVQIDDSISEIITSTRSSEYYTNFASSNIIEKNSDGSLVFVEKDNTNNKVWGILSNSGILISYSDPYTFIKRPFGYLDSLLDISQRTYVAYGSHYLGQGMTKALCDGYGKLILPNNIKYEEVLRIYFEQKYVDSSSSGTMNITIKSFAWFDSKHKSALLKIDYTTIKSQYYNNSTSKLQYLKREVDINTK